MKNTMGIILTGGKNNRLKELSAKRSISAVPVGGKYRTIDFTLSNFVNSGVTNIGVLTQYSFRSLMDHLGSGKEWDLDRKNDGLFIFPPYLSGDDNGWYRGSADAMYNNLTFLRRSNEKYVIIAQGNCIYKMNFDDMLDFHINKNSDITVAYREMNNYSDEEMSLLGLLKVDENKRIVDLQEKPRHPWTKTGSMGIYIINRELLIALLEESAAHGNYDFVKDILIKKLNELNLFGYEFKGYWRSLSTIQMYYKCNMELLNPETRRELFIDSGRIYTKVKDEPPAKYNDEAEVKNSIIADGCIIEGTVENSVLFRGVTVKRGAFIKDSIIMQGASIEEGAVLNYAILDKGVVMTEGKCLKGEPNWPIIVGKNVRV
ncbi:MAG: glucose-1-phosphate adenylyltransferase subunit GlgD [Clostridia bacterium]|nr:glucose-1-phosphate adenylyltransferase subunit GlgD [Clostridia bacterium]